MSDHCSQRLAGSEITKWPEDSLRQVRRVHFARCRARELPSALDTPRTTGTVPKVIRWKLVTPPALSLFVLGDDEFCMVIGDEADPAVDTDVAALSHVDSRETVSQSG